MSLINVYSAWCALRMFIMIWTDNVPMIRINFYINLHHLNSIVIQWYGGGKLNFLLKPVLSWLSRPYPVRWFHTHWPPGCSTFLENNSYFPTIYSLYDFLSRVYISDSQTFSSCAYQFICKYYMFARKSTVLKIL